MLVVPLEIITSTTVSLFNFICCKKPNKVKRQVLYQDYQNGGLWVPNFEVMSKAIKFASIGRFLSFNSLMEKKKLESNSRVLLWEIQQSKFPLKM